ncbi:MAG: hypothetical protein KDC35_13140 [Acidobacteria bacterium]|nr:hypothetical protein [Acidobacteriota bacterium]
MTTVMLLLFLLVLSYGYVNSQPRGIGRKSKKWFGVGQATVTPIDRGRMSRCHNCGCFVPDQRKFMKVIEGHILEFCSTDCRGNFRYH